jgi:hypothetical protein
MIPRLQLVAAADMAVIENGIQGDDSLKQPRASVDRTSSYRKLFALPREIAFPMVGDKKRVR